MSKKKRAKNKSSFARMLPGLVITLLAVGALFFLVDVDEMRHAFTLADYRWLPLVLILFFGTLFARSMAWRTVLKERAPFWVCFFVLNQAYLFNNVLPFRLGELGRAVILSNRSKMGFWQVLSTIVIERVFDVGIAAGLLLATAPLVVGSEWARPAAIAAVGLVFAGFVVLFVMASQPKFARRVIAVLTKPWPKLGRWLKPKLDSFLEGLAVLRDSGRFVRVVFWMGLTWTFNVAWYFVLLRSFVPQAALLWAVFGIGVASMGVALPSSPAYIGVLEAAMVGALSLFGVDPALALAYAVVAHVIYFAVTGLLGVIGFWQQGQSLGDVYQKLLARPAGN
jgi:uncharacterized protein (TIRG00374 family)